MINSPSVTIILPAYNGARWIKKALKSALSQSFRDFELIVINDGSTDTTEEVVLTLAKEDGRILYVKNEHNIGIQKTRNRALDFAKGEFIAEIDQDDEWIDTNKLEKQIDFLRQHGDHVLSGTGAVVVDDTGREISRYLMPLSDRDIRKKILRANCFIHSSVVYRKKSVKDIGGYTPEKMSEDHDLWLRLGRIGKFMNFPDYSVRYLFSAGGYNSQNKTVRLKQNIENAFEHKNFYPNYWQAVVLGWGKIIFYPLFNLMPKKIQGMFLKLHKKI